MRPNELRRISENWRSVARIGAVLAGIGLIIVSFVGGRDPFTGDMVVGAMLISLLIGGIGIALVAGVFILLAAMLDGIAGIQSILEKLPGGLGAGPVPASARPAFKTPESPPSR